MNTLIRFVFTLFSLNMLVSCASPRKMPTQTSALAHDMIKPGDKIGEMTIVSESIFTHKWPVEHYAVVARHLGQFNGAYLAGQSFPSEPWDAYWLY